MVSVKVPIPTCLAGRQLAMKHCTPCHRFTEPELLPKKSWEFLLTYMGFFLGVVDYRYVEGISERAMDVIEAREEFVRAAQLLPEQPLLTEDQWAQFEGVLYFQCPGRPHPSRTQTCSG